MQEDIRHAVPHDYAAITRVHNDQNEPDFHTTPEGLRRADERSATRDPAFRRFVAEMGGEVIATGDFRSSWAGESRPGKFWTLIHVREDHRQEGVDVRILDQARREAEGPVAEVWTCVREDFVPAAGFIAAEQFVERFRSWGSHLGARPGTRQVASTPSSRSNATNLSHWQHPQLLVSVSPTYDGSRSAGNRRSQVKPALAVSPP